MRKQLITLACFIFAVLHLNDGRVFVGDVRVSAKTAKVRVSAVVDGTEDHIEVDLKFPADMVKAITFDAEATPPKLILHSEDN